MAAPQNCYVWMPVCLKYTFNYADSEVLVTQQDLLSKMSSGLQGILCIQPKYFTRIVIVIMCHVISEFSPTKYQYYLPKSATTLRFGNHTYI